MLRNEWEFDYPVGTVSEAVATKVKYHNERIDFWQREHESVLEQVREKGLDIRAREVTGGKRHELMLDPELAKRLDECESKIANHQRRYDEYSLWLSVLAELPDQGDDLSLHHDDITYFGLHGLSEDDG